MVWPDRGSISSGAISARGTSTKRRTASDGWGIVRTEDDKTIRPKIKMSISIGRGPLGGEGRRPKSRSMDLQHASRPLGSRDVLDRQTRLRKGG